MSFDKEDFEKFISWGLKIYPTKIERDELGKKKPALFPRNSQLTKEWKWWAKHQQIDITYLLEHQSNGFGLASVLPPWIAVIDVDDIQGYLEIKSILDNLHIKYVSEKSLSWTSDNQKHHFYFYTSQSVSYSASLKDYGFKGMGELLGSGHLVFLNNNGWETPPSEFGELPDLSEVIPEIKQKSALGFNNQLSIQNNIKNNLLNPLYKIKYGQIHNYLVRVRGMLAHRGANPEMVIKILKLIVEEKIEPPYNKSDATLKDIQDIAYSKFNSDWNIKKGISPPEKNSFNLSEYLKNLKQRG